MNQLIFVLLILLAAPIYAVTDEEKARLEALRGFSLEDLQELEVYNPAGGLAARKDQKLRETPGALFIISEEDIRRGGFTSIPEALRLVPGVQVGRIDGNKWAISARGFNGRFAGKLLVMIDGRTVYSQLRSEVYWDVQDTLLEDVERIEVLRGPGAALWGANAVNGVINIVTKPAAKTQGMLASAHVGSAEERAITGLRYGGATGENGHYRVYGKYYDYDYMDGANGRDQDSRWRNGRAGFRVDQQAGEYDHFTLQGDAYDGWTHQEKTANRQISAETIDIHGYNLLGRWYREQQHGDMSLQVYYDYTGREEPRFTDTRDTLDFDFQQRLVFDPRLEFIWGLGYRRTEDDIRGSATQYYTPPQRNDSLYSAFINADYALIPQELRLIAGAKFSHNGYSGAEVQPNLRLLWTPSSTHQTWAAISRALRTPSRTDEDFNLIVPMSPTMNLRIQGDDEFESEEVLAYELGWRYTPAKDVLIDTALFYNQYDKLGPYGQSVGFESPNTVLQSIVNGFEGDTYGAEIAARWQVHKDWRLSAAYSYFDSRSRYMPGITPSSAASISGRTPHHQASLSSYFQLSSQWQFDTALYYVDNVPTGNIAKYLRLDARLAWKPRKQWELALGGRNLTDNHHPEFNADLGEVSGEVPRSVYLQLRYGLD